jgi:4-amino-4-deoxy-L-arabinose transferase-like glycosyltransferase
MESTTLHRVVDSFLRPHILIGWVVIVALVRFVNLGFLDLQAWDEGLYALRSKSIVQFGEWLDQTSYVPGGLATSCYPPLTFWTTAAFYKIFGASEWTTRFTSALFGAGSVLLLVALARRLASKFAALVAGILFGTNLFYTFFTRQGQLDVAYIFFLLLSAYGWAIWSGGERKTQGLGMIALGTCGAFMSKILVGFYIPLILLFVQAVDMRHRWRWRRLIEISAAIATGIALALPWHVFMYVRHGKGFLEAFFGLHVLQRLSTPIEGHDPALGIFFYVNQLFVHYPESALGIGLILLLFFKRIDRTRISQRGVTLSAVWSLVVIAIISVMATKIQQYMLPLSVPIALLGSIALALLAEGSLKKGSGVVLLALFSVTTSWSALWPARAYIKNSVLGIAEVTPHVALPWGMAGIALTSICFCLYLLFRRSKEIEGAIPMPLFVVTLLMLLTLRYTFEITVSDRTQFAVGTKRVASFLRGQQAQRVLYLGKDLNPAFDLYLKGWETWRTDIRLDYYLSEATALAPKSTSIDLPRPGEVTFLVEEKRIAGKELFTNLPAFKDGGPPIFGNDTYLVYRLTSSK